MTRKIYGLLVDNESRCQHYHTELDIVALKCFGCLKYYACYQCHDSLEEHIAFELILVISSRTRSLCGVYQHEMVIDEYQEAIVCPNCHSAFNLACSKHYDIYFEK